MFNAIKNKFLKVKYDAFEEFNNLIKTDLNKELFIISKLSIEEKLEYIKSLEKSILKFLNIKYGYLTNSGTEALELTLKTLGIGKGDEVITAPNSFIGTALAIKNVAEKPVFVDVNEYTFNIDINKIEEKITDKTKAIILVHLYGSPADMDEIMKIAKGYKLFIVEDSCSAFGAEYKGKKTGSIGHFGCFSFNKFKTISTLNAGGFIATNNKKLANKIKFNNLNIQLRDIAILKSKLKYYKNFINKKNNLVKQYKKLIFNKKILPNNLSDRVYIYEDFVIKSKNRDLLFLYLYFHGIETRIHFRTPLHLHKEMRYLKYKKSDFPVAEKLCKSVLSLPINPFITKYQIKYITNKINRFNKVLVR